MNKIVLICFCKVFIQLLLALGFVTELSGVGAPYISFHCTTLYPEHKFDISFPFLNSLL